MSLGDSMLTDNRILVGLEEIKKQMGEEEFKMLIGLLHQNKGNELQVLQELTQYTYNEKPVSMETFLLDSNYLGLKGQLYPRLVDDLCEMFEGGYDEAVLAGGIGWGKSTVAECAIARMVYEVSCYKNPQAVYDLAEGTRITFVNVSLNLSHAEEVVFHGIKTKLLNSPYFNNHFLYDKNLKTEMKFPNNIIVMPTSNPIGHNVFGGVLDEVNFMSLVEQSKHARGGRYDMAEDLHSNIIRRMKSRFMKKGKLPGILLSISSSKYPEDFTERMFAQAETDDSIFARRYSQWGTKPKSFFIGESFKVSLGDGSSKEPKVLKHISEIKEEEKKGVKIIDVPIEYIKDFETDLDGSIRDLAGYPTLTILPFIRQRDKIFDAIARGETDYKLEHPFSKLETTLEDGGVFLLDKLKKHGYPCFIHNDLSLSGDSSGFCMGHVSGYKQVTRRNEEGVEFSITEPIIVIDLMLKITAPHQGEIKLSNVRSLVFELQSYGFNIQKVTYDQFQSADSRQIMEGRGMKTERVSADGNPEVYGSLRDAFYEDRINMYDYPPVVRELLRLEKSEKTGKVDHPSDGSKDITDALAGVTYLCANSKPIGTVMPVMGTFDSNRNNMPHNIDEIRKKKTETVKQNVVDKYLDDVIDYYGW